jgi:SAM-dependent methyltransferase
MAGMVSAEGEYQLYRELADWWPLISPLEEYAQEASYLGAVLASALGEDAGRTSPAVASTVLDLGCGGGHVAVHLKDRFDLTLLDLSDDMLAVSQRLNPECEHVQGDMRSARLGRQFDAVLAHDAIDYIITEADLRLVVATAFAHCRPGGMAAFVPDYVKDSFGELTGGGGGGTDQSGRKASFRERTWDPDPSDDWVQAEYEFMLKSADGAVQLIRETHRLGAFSHDTWAMSLCAAGFEPAPGFLPKSRFWPVPPGTEGRQDPLPGQRPENLFLARRPA